MARFDQQHAHIIYRAVTTIWNNQRVMSIDLSGSAAEARFPPTDEPVVSIEHALGVRLVLHSATVDYLASRSAVAGPTRRAFASAVAEGRLDANSTWVLRRAVELYTLFTEGRRPTGPDPRTRSITFVVGPPRCGGRAAMARLAEHSGLSFSTLPTILDGEALPDTSTVLASRGDLIAFAQALFELAQALALAESVIPPPLPVVQRRSAYAFWIEAIEQYLGGAVSYVVPIRHPLACALSIAEHARNRDEDGEGDTAGLGVHALQGEAFQQVRIVRGIDERKWQSLNTLNRARLLWEAQLTAVASTPGLGKRLVPVVYTSTKAGERTSNGSPTRRPRSRGRARSLSQCDPRHLANDYGADHADFERSIDRVRRAWQGAGYDFPEIPFA